MGSSPLQGLENCLREIPVPGPQPAWSWSSAGDRGPRRAEAKNWTADTEGKARLPGVWEQEEVAPLRPPLAWPLPAAVGSCPPRLRRRSNLAWPEACVRPGSQSVLLASEQWRHRGRTPSATIRSEPSRGPGNRGSFDPNCVGPMCLGVLHSR